MKFQSLQKIVLLVVLWMSIPFCFSQTTPLSKEAKISVLTCGTSNEIYALFGHTAIRVNDPVNGMDVVYNYGAFDFGTSNFALKFVKGNLQYLLMDLIMRLYLIYLIMIWLLYQIVVVNGSNYNLHILAKPLMN